MNQAKSFSSKQLHRTGKKNVSPIEIGVLDTHARPVMHGSRTIDSCSEHFSSLAEREASPTKRPSSFLDAGDTYPGTPHHVSHQTERKKIPVNSTTNRARGHGGRKQNDVARCNAHSKNCNSYTSFSGFFDLMDLKIIERAELRGH